MPLPTMQGQGRSGAGGQLGIDGEKHAENFGDGKMNWADRNGYNFLSQYATREESDMDMTNEQPQPDVLMVWAENLAQAKALKTMAEDALSKANEQIASAEEKLSEIMAERDIASFKTTDGRLFYKYVSSFPKVKNETAFYEWLADHGEAGIIKRTIHPQTLRAWYKDKSLEHGEELADKLEVFEKIRIGVRT